MTPFGEPRSDGIAGCSAHRGGTCLMLLLAAGGFALPWSRASLAAAATSADRELEQLAAEYGIDLADDSLWQTQYEFEAGIGYRDNPTLAPFAPDGATVINATASAFATYQFSEYAEWRTLFDATSTHHVAADTADARLIFGRTEVGWNRGGPLETALAVQLVHQAEVIDVSTLDYGSGSARIHVVSPGLEAKVRWTPLRSWAVVGRHHSRWSDFRAPFDNLWEHAVTLAVERKLGRAGVVGVAYRGLWRDFARRPQAAIGGRELPGTELGVAQHGGELQYSCSGGQTLSWSARVHAGFVANADNGTGWYDYHRVELAGAVSCDYRRWHADLDVGWRDYDYRWQTSGFGLDPPHKQRDELVVVLRVELKLDEAWTVFVEADLDRSRSNDPYLNFHDRTLGMGLRWSSGP